MECHNGFEHCSPGDADPSTLLIERIDTGIGSLLTQARCLERPSHFWSYIHLEPNQPLFLKVNPPK